MVRKQVFAMTCSENKEGWEDRILRDPKAYMLIERLFRNIEQETDADIDELDMNIHEFLQDLGLGNNQSILLFLTP